ncbi:MAG: hypothetical protein CVV42_19855 [Candidatus Riflebacteria bacterium HGW-Riflebacteria-2]|jgi:hypothetical protein|nr:MAG: hypothetical protein CVV42_19855 [Candidatus Riflebacteria bacterium HGW-Riflebacteria-2]
MIEIKTKVRECEKTLVVIGVMTAMILVMLWHRVGTLYYAFLTGYLIGFASFIMLAESFSSFDKLPQWFTMLALLLSNLKMLLIGLLIFVLKLLGFSVVQMIFGILFSQIAIIFSFVTTVYLDKKTVEEYKNKAKDART